jgi:hypothetical protein
LPESAQLLLRKTFFRHFYFVKLKEIEQKSFEQNSFEQNSFDQNSFEQKSFEQKSFEQKSFKHKSFEQNSFEQKSLEHKSFKQNSFEQNSPIRGIFGIFEMSERSICHAGRVRTESGLPDYLFAYQKSQFWYILDGLGVENVCILHFNLVYFVVVWYVVWPLTKFCCCLAHFPHFGILYQGKSGNPEPNRVETISGNFVSKKNSIRKIRENSLTQDGGKVRTEGGGRPPAGGHAVAEASRHGREEHAQPLPKEHGRPHRGDQEPVALS